MTDFAFHSRRTLLRNPRAERMSNVLIAAVAGVVLGGLMALFV
jgi:hypothetical protein